MRLQCRHFFFLLQNKIPDLVFYTVHAWLTLISWAILDKPEHTEWNKPLFLISVTHTSIASTDSFRILQLIVIYLCYTFHSFFFFGVISTCNSIYRGRVSVYCDGLLWGRRPFQEDQLPARCSVLRRPSKSQTFWQWQHMWLGESCFPLGVWILTP